MYYSGFMTAVLLVVPVFAVGTCSNCIDSTSKRRKKGAQNYDTREHTISRA